MNIRGLYEKQVLNTSKVIAASGSLFECLPWLYYTLPIRVPIFLT
ncbi:MAG TPA: hypothetical protein PK174_00430 [Anaerolineaceae bacterium]|nr:hypothetical protein [Anaerolineaceae bacterium]HQP07431.1 hypothetical protein [Anaerolineaceae bacterium]